MRQITEWYNEIKLSYHGNIKSRYLDYTKEIDNLKQGFDRRITSEEYKIEYQDMIGNDYLSLLWFKADNWTNKEKEEIVKYYLKTKGNLNSVRS